MAYTDNCDGTITDQHTGLTWQQVLSDASFTWQEAVDYVDDLELGGHDWRLPSAKGWSIADFSSSWPYLDTDYFSLASGLVTKEAGDSDDGYYWSSTPAPFTAGEPYYYAWSGTPGSSRGRPGEPPHRR